MRVLVTGGLGFIGSHFINHLIQSLPGVEIINLDKLGFGANPRNVIPSPRVTTLIRDIANSASFADIKGIDLVFHFAAESHVDRSLESALPFISSNVIGTHNVLEFCRKIGARLIAISTDEVYGSIEEGSATETNLLKPGNPYSASKASADMLCLAYHNTHGLDVITARNSLFTAPHRKRAERRVEAGSEGVRYLRFGTQRPGHEDCREKRLVGLSPFQKLQTAHHRHFQIRDDEIAVICR
jgi:dTDP-glucose 4,6-dehydratase